MRRNYLSNPSNANRQSRRRINTQRTPRLVRTSTFAAVCNLQVASKITLASQRSCFSSILSFTRGVHVRREVDGGDWQLNAMASLAPSLGVLLVGLGLPLASGQCTYQVSVKIPPLWNSLSVVVGVVLLWSRPLMLHKQVFHTDHSCLATWYNFPADRTNNASFRSLTEKNTPTGHHRGQHLTQFKKYMPPYHVLERSSS